MADLKDLNTKGEVADYCRVEVRTVDRWMASGRLRFVRLPGGGVRFTRGQVLKALDLHFDDQPSRVQNDPSMG